MTVEASTESHYSKRTGRPFSHPVVEMFSRPKLDWIGSRTNLLDKKVLEVGAGNGYFSKHLMGLCDLTATDISSRQLDANPAIQKKVCSVYDLPYGDGSFDYVFSSNLLHHLKDPQVAVNEMERVAGKGVLLVEPCRNNPVLLAGVLGLRHEWGALRYSKGFVSRLVERSGMTLEGHTYQGGMVMPNVTPRLLLPLAFGESQSFLSFFQIFICGKPGPAPA